MKRLSTLLVLSLCVMIGFSTAAAQQAPNAYSGFIYDLDVSVTVPDVEIPLNQPVSGSLVIYSNVELFMEWQHWNPGYGSRDWEAIAESVLEFIDENDFGEATIFQALDEIRSHLMNNFPLNYQVGFNLETNESQASTHNVKTDGVTTLHFPVFPDDDSDYNNQRLEFELIYSQSEPSYPDISADIIESVSDFISENLDASEGYLELNRALINHINTEYIIQHIFSSQIQVNPSMSQQPPQWPVKVFGYIQPRFLPQNTHEYIELTFEGLGYINNPTSIKGYQVNWQFFGMPDPELLADLSDVDAFIRAEVEQFNPLTDPMTPFIDELMMEIESMNDVSSRFLNLKLKTDWSESGFDIDFTGLFGLMPQTETYLKNFGYAFRGDDLETHIGPIAEYSAFVNQHRWGDDMFVPEVDELIGVLKSEALNPTLAEPEEVSGYEYLSLYLTFLLYRNGYPLHDFVSLGRIETDAIIVTDSGIQVKFSIAGDAGGWANIEDDGQTPVNIALDQNYPNPFNPVTTLGFDLVNPAEVTLEVFDIIGRRVAVLADGLHAAGTHNVRFDGSMLSSGVYLARLKSENQTQFVKMLLVK